MSIIYDALKKVQNKIDKHSKAALPVYNISEDKAILPPPRIPKSYIDKTTEPASQAERNTSTPVLSTAFGFKDQKKYQKTLITLCSLICGILIFLIGYLFYLFGVTHDTEWKGTPQNEGIVLQGTMTKDDKNVALINDEIYEVGESVNGKKILKIGVNSIQIKDRWWVKTLYVKKKPE